MITLYQSPTFKVLYEWGQLLIVEPLTIFYFYETEMGMSNLFRDLRKAISYDDHKTISKLTQIVVTYRNISRIVVDNQISE